ncbi:MAG: heme ABC transporter ATP-binding protein [Chloroflexota bacterium]
MLDIQDISVAYGARCVLEDISFQVARGEVLALIGPNGAGKTTLLRTLSGTLRPNRGTVCVDGQDISQLSENQRARLMSVVPQARQLPEAFTVWETVLLGRTPYLGWLGRPGERDRQAIRTALERTETSHLATRRIGQLSGGEQQRVLMARALAQDTPLLLLDEPTTHLDLHHQADLLNLAQELAHERNLAVVMALHDLNHASLYADRVALLEKGRLLALGTPVEVLTSLQLSSVYRMPLHVITHPDYGVPLILPDGLKAMAQN